MSHRVSLCIRVCPGLGSSGGWNPGSEVTRLEGRAHVYTSDPSGQVASGEVVPQAARPPGAWGKTHVTDSLKST